MLPHLKTPVPGPKSRALARELHSVECPHITYVAPDFPVFWESARGVAVTDADGNRFLDLSSAFGVSSLGHAAPAVRRAITRQIRRMWHGMGDVHPPRIKLECMKRIGALLPRTLSHFILSSTGSEAVESALKTAFLHTRRPGVVAFDGSYHGLGYGAMQATHRPFFREPFVKQTGTFVRFFEFFPEGSARAAVRRGLARLAATVRAGRTRRIGAILIEVVQGRGGMRPADPFFLKGLRRIADGEKIVLIFDEVFTGFGRTGRCFAFEHYGVVPDMLCLGKAMSNGFPISACVASKRIMGAWGPSPGEARHTSTFLGNPLGCAMTIATIDALVRGRFFERAARLGRVLRREAERLADAHPSLVACVRGRGMMHGIVFRRPRDAGRFAKAALKEGVIVLTSGEDGSTVGLTPPFVITADQIRGAARVFDRILGCLR